jgi:hypothetical protein
MIVIYSWYRSSRILFITQLACSLLNWLWDQISELLSSCLRLCMKYLPIDLVKNLRWRLGRLFLESCLCSLLLLKWASKPFSAACLIQQLICLFLSSTLQAFQRLIQLFDREFFYNCQFLIRSILGSSQKLYAKSRLPYPWLILAYEILDQC